MNDEPRTGEPLPLNYAPPPPRPPPPDVPLYRKVFAGMLFCAGTAVALAGAFQTNGAARANIALVGFGLIVYGFVIRFQHVKLW